MAASAKYRIVKQDPEDSDEWEEEGKEKKEKEKEKEEEDEEEKEEEDAKEAQESEWTTQRKLYVIASWMVNLLTCATLTIIVPYFPIVGVRMGVSKSVIGLVFSVCRLVGAVVAPLTGKMIVSTSKPLLQLQIVGFKVLVIGGFTLGGTIQVLFGFGIMLPDKTSFVVFAFICRAVATVGTVVCYTAMVAFLGQEFRANLATVMGLCEIFSGLGMASAPAVGGAIYQLGGYIWPTAALGLVIFATTLFLVVLTRNVDFKGSTSNARLLESVLRLLKIPAVLISVESCFAIMVLLSAIEPVFAIFGKEVLHLEVRQIGFIYSALWISYLLFSFLAGIILDKIPRYLLAMVVGFTSSTVGILLLGPAPFLDRIFPVGTIWLTVLAEIFIGIGIGFGFIPVMPYMIQSISDAGMESDVITNSLLVGMFMSSCYVGAFVGPILAGTLADYVDVRTDFMIIGFVLAAQVVLLVSFGLSRYCTKRSKDMNKC